MSLFTWFRSQKTSHWSVAIHHIAVVMIHMSLDMNLVSSVTWYKSQDKTHRSVTKHLTLCHLNIFYHMRLDISHFRLSTWHLIPGTSHISLDISHKTSATWNKCLGTLHQTLDTSDMVLDLSHSALGTSHLKQASNHMTIDNHQFIILTWHWTPETECMPHNTWHESLVSGDTLHLTQFCQPELLITWQESFNRKSSRVIRVIRDFFSIPTLRVSSLWQKNWYVKQSQKKKATY